MKAEGFCDGRVSIAHCRNAEMASQLKDLILSAYGDASVEVHETKGLCSFYAENGGILVGFEKA
jgi:fatty acid-binding protein DegV